MKVGAGGSQRRIHSRLYSTWALPRYWQSHARYRAVDQLEPPVFPFSRPLRQSSELGAKAQQNIASPVTVRVAVKLMG